MTNSCISIHNICRARYSYNFKKSNTWKPSPDFVMSGLSYLNISYGLTFFDNIRISLSLYINGKYKNIYQYKRLNYALPIPMEKCLWIVVISASAGEPSTIYGAKGARLCFNAGKNLFIRATLCRAMTMAYRNKLLNIFSKHIARSSVYVYSVRWLYKKTHPLHVKYSCLEFDPL